MQMHVERLLLSLIRPLTPVHDRAWLAALEAELPSVSESDRGSWLAGALGLIATSLWRAFANDPWRLVLALLVGLLMSSGDGLTELRAYVGVVSFVAFLKPHWSWRLAVLAGLVPHILGGMGIGPMARMDVPLPVMPGFFAALIACWLGARYDSFQQRRTRKAA